MSAPSSEEKLDRWALDYADWFARNRRMKMRDLPGFRGRLYRSADVKDAALDAFVLLGATSDMPYSVFERLSSGDAPLECDPVQHYVGLIALRRVMQGVVEEDADAPEPDRRGGATRARGSRARVQEARMAME